MSHVQSVPKASTPLATDTLQLSGVVAGHSLLVAIRLSASGDYLTSLTDSITSDGPPVRIVDQLSPTAGLRTYVFKKENCAAGDHLFTANWGTNQTWRWIAAEYSESEIDVFDLAAFASGTGITGPALTASLAGGTLVGFISLDSSTTIAPNNGETERQEVNTALQLEDKAAAALGPYAPQWLLGAARAGIAVALIMKGTPVATKRSDHTAFRGIGRGMFRGF